MSLSSAVITIMVYLSSMKRSPVKIWVYLATTVTTIILLISGNGCNKGTSPETSTYVLKFGHLANEDHPWHKAALKFAEIVKENSGARIEVKVYPNEQLGKELDMITGILAGTVDMTISGESMQNWRSEEHTSELQSRRTLVCRLLLETKKKKTNNH